MTDDRKLILNDFIAYRMANFAKQVSDSCSQIYEVEFGLSVPEWRILARLAENQKEGMSNENSSKIQGNEAFSDKAQNDKTLKDKAQKDKPNSSKMTAKDLGEITFMDKSKVSRAVKLMDEKGYLVKEKDPNDNRATYLSLSPQGQALYQQLVPKALNWEDELIDCLSASEYRNFVQALEKLEQQAQKMS